MSYMPKCLGHVNIFVRNAEQARDWYEDLLGLHTHDFKPGVAAFMSADKEISHEIALLEVGENAPLQQKGQVGLNHMAWYMYNLEDLKELYHRVKGKEYTHSRHLGSRPVHRDLYRRPRRQRHRAVLRAATEPMGPGR